MHLSIFLFLAVLCVRSFAAAMAATPSPQLLRLEAILTQKLQERKSGAMPSDQYRVFAAKFRDDLDAALEQGPETSINRGRHAMILARLDESGAGQAMADLDQAIDARPGDAALLNAKGSIQLQQGDYSGALASAEAVLKQNEERGEPPDPDALALRQFSKGRGEAAAEQPTARTLPPHPVTVENQGGPPAFQFTQRQPRGKVEIPSAGAEYAPTSDADLNVVTNPIAWTKTQIVKGPQKAVGILRNSVGLEPEEEGAALTGASYGAVTGAALGVGLGVAALGPCGPSGVFGGVFPIWVCASIAGGAAVTVLTTGGSIMGGYINVAMDRFHKSVLENGGPDFIKKEE